MSLQKILIYLLFLGSVGVVIYSCQNSAQLQQDMYYTNGRDLYIKHCQNCHGSNGEGLGALTPPLTDTTYFRKNKNKLACFIKHGLNVPITIQGQIYEDKMPGFSTLATIDITQLIVFITNAHGHKQGMYKTDQVSADLNNCK